MDPSAVGIVFLTPALFLAQAANVLTETQAYIHAELKTRLSSINLQTISDISVDFVANESLVSLMIDTVLIAHSLAIGALAAELPPLLVFG